MKLYGARGWGSAIVEAMLALAGEPYEFVDVLGFDQPGPQRDTLAAINPLLQVPALLLDGGEVLTESAAIGLWLLDRHPGLAPPRGTPTHRLFLRLLVWFAANVYPTFTYGDYPDRWCPTAPGELEASTDRHREGLYRWLEEQVQSPFVLGQRISLLDCYAAVVVDWRPRRAWFEANAPKLLGAADLARARQELRTVMALNGLAASNPGR